LEPHGISAMESSLAADTSRAPELRLLMGIDTGASADCLGSDRPLLPSVRPASGSVRGRSTQARTRFAWLLAVGCAVLWTASPGLAQQAKPKSKAQERFDANTQCVEPASEFHNVNPSVVKAILKVESSGNPTAINRNKNGTVDVGIGQYNSMHFKDLASYGIAPEQLFDACTAIYVTAWHLSKQIKRHGNTWFAIGAYHSATPFFNSRYQALINNALIDLGYADWPRMKVPPMPASAVASRSPSKSGESTNDGLLAISQ
jgi:hypothetical protein